MDAEKLDCRQFLQEVENHANQILNAPLALTRGELESNKDFCKRKIADLRKGLDLVDDDDRVEVVMQILKYRGRLANVEDALQELAAEPAKKPIDRTGLAAEWEKLTDVDRRIGVCLDLKGIKDDTYRKWKTGKFKDASPSASRIVQVLVDDLRAAGVDVSRFGVVVGEIVPVLAIQQ